MNIIEVKELSKNFGRLVAVDKVSFDVNEGEIFGFLGPNGAGKTTTINMLCTLLTPAGGKATVNGYDVVTQSSQVRRQIGFMSANTAVYDRMTAWEMVEYFGRLHGIDAESLAEAAAKHAGTARALGGRDA